MDYPELNGFHDYMIETIGIGPEPDSLSLVFKNEIGNKKQLLLSGCDFFRVQDFIYQNVVSRIMIISGPNSNVDYIKECLEWASSLSDSKSFLADDKMDALAKMIINGEKKLVIVEPSYGAELMALCSKLNEQIVAS